MRSYQRDGWKGAQSDGAKVRTRWARFLDTPPGVHLKTKPDGMAMIMPMFQQAEAVQDGKRVKDAQLDAVFAQWVEPAN